MIVCFRHPKFNPETDLPDLTCKTCCNLYVIQIKTNQRKIIASSIKEIGRKNGKTVNFDPSAI
jgi:hypothetical protein